jgi:tRNA threonylcarbamoyladenosine biosynthesis protein TsaE
MSHYKTYLPDEAATLALGKNLVPCLQPGLAIYLHGDLGAGKTALTRALLHAAGHQGHVKSPTYALVEPYSVQVQGQPCRLMHFDLYRLGSAEEFLDAGFREEFNGSTICIVEWPEKADGVLPSPDIQINLRIAGAGREVELQAMSDKGNACLTRLKFAPNL